MLRQFKSWLLFLYMKRLIKWQVRKSNDEGAKCEGELLADAYLSDTSSDWKSRTEL